MTLGYAVLSLILLVTVWGNPTPLDHPKTVSALSGEFDNTSHVKDGTEKVVPPLPSSSSVPVVPSSLPKGDPTTPPPTTTTSPTPAPTTKTTTNTPAPTNTTTAMPTTSTTSTTTTTVAPSTTTTVAPTNTTVAPPTTTTVAPTNTTVAPITTSTGKPATTTVPTPTTSRAPPVPDRKFDGLSFIGGIILSIGIMAIGLVAWKFYKARHEREYRTL